MEMNNEQASLNAVSLGGRKNATITFSMGAPIYLSEVGDETLADKLFRACPALFAAMQKDAGSPKATWTEDAEGIFDGLKAHRFRLWGLPASDRAPDALPLVDTNSANIRGKVVIEINYGDGEGNVAATVKFPVKVPAGEVGGLTFREMGSQLGGECWIELVPIQGDLEETPEIRKPAKEQGDLFAVPSPVDKPDADEEFAGDHRVVVDAVPELALPVVKVFESLGFTAGESREMIEEIRANTPQSISGLTADGAANAVIAFDAAGAKARVEVDEDADDEPLEEKVEEQVDADDPRLLTATPAGLPNPGDDGWEAPGFKALAAMSIDDLNAYLGLMTIEQLAEQHQAVTGKPTRSIDLAFIISKIKKRLSS